MAFVSFQAFDKLFVARQAHNRKIRQIGNGFALFLGNKLPCRAIAFPFIDFRKSDDQRIKNRMRARNAGNNVILVHMTGDKIDWFVFMAGVRTSPAEVIGDARLCESARR